MTDTIGVEFAAQDAAFLASTKAATALMAGLAAQESKLSAFAKSAGLDQKKFAAAFAASERGKVQDAKAFAQGQAKVAKETKQQADIETKAKKANAKEVDRLAKLEVSNAKKKKVADDKYAAQTKKANDYKNNAAKESKKNLAEDVSGLKAGALAAVGMGAAVVGVAVAAGVTLIAIGKVALAAKEARDNSRGFMNVLTAGRGDKALAMLDGLATQLGQKVQDVRDQWVQFRQAGLGNKQSAQLIKLVADLKTVDKSGKLADEAVSKVLAFTANGTQTGDQARAAARSMALLAKQANVAGTGANAAAEGASTLVGALSRLDNSKTKALESIGDKIAPSVNRASSAVATLVENFLASKRGQQAIDGVSGAISKLADFVTAAAPRVGELGAFLEKSLNNPKVQMGLEALQGVLYLAGAACGALAAGALLLEAPIIAVGAAAITAVAGIGYLVKKAVDLTPQMYNAGKNLVSGLVNGIIASGSQAVDAVTGLAHNISKSFKSALGIQSPSKVFTKFGDNIGQGTQRGIDRSMPDGRDMAARMVPAGKMAANDNAGSGSPSASGARTVTITIENITVPSGADPDTWARSLRRELTLFAETLDISQGLGATG